MSGRKSKSHPGLELVVVANDVSVVEPLPASGSVSLGRGEECAIRINDNSVSRRHAILHLDPPLRIEDLGSRNGTFLRDTRSRLDSAATFQLRQLSKASLELAVGERVHLGAVVIVVRKASPAAGRTGAPPASNPAVVRDPAMVALYEQATRAARSPISVLILGETGVGKEILARTIHDRSPRADDPYVELNCAALAPSLLESELFGHEKNAFTGAEEAREGLLESADGGTIFLDEVGELPLDVQAKLLRVLDDHKVMRVGGRKPTQLDVRFIAATNRDLEAEIARGTFRQDLYFRLNRMVFTIPALRERVVEIAPLAERFIADTCGQFDRTELLHLSLEALGYLERYAWPGNVRELRNVMERAVVLCSSEEILPADLPAHVTGVRTAPVGVAGAKPKTADAVREASASKNLPDTASRSTYEPEAEERRKIMDALEKNAGNQTRAAKHLGIALRTLVKRLEKFGIPRPRKSS